MKKLALIGCGGIGKYHLENFLKLRGLVELAGFCDIIVPRAKNFVKLAGSGKAFADFAEMYDEIKPDMVFICVPPTCHGEIEFETIRRNIPFFVEKPLALEPAVAKAILQKVREKNLITASGFQCRYDEINKAAKEYIQTHEVVHIQASRVGAIPEVPWWRIKATSGGQLVEQTVHQMDMLRYLLDDEPERVYSVASSGYITQEECPGYLNDDLSTTVVVFQKGVTCTMMTGCYSMNASAWDSKMTFGARESRMDYHLITKAVFFGTEKASEAPENLGGVISGDGMQRKGGTETSITVETKNDFGVECDRTFMEAVITGDPSGIRSSYADAWKSVAFTLACNKSMETGLPVKVAELLS